MRLILFFVHFCFLLLSGSTAFCAGSHIEDKGIARTAISSEFGIQRASQIDKDFLILSDISSDVDLADIVDDDLEDDEAPSFVPQYVLTEGVVSNSTYPSYSALLYHGSNSFSAPACPMAHPTGKYILQGVLRI